MNATSVMPEPARRKPGLVGPTILIAMGVIFLLNNLGLVSWDIWGTLLQLWPILLIALGLDMLVGRRRARPKGTSRCSKWTPTARGQNGCASASDRPQRTGCKSSMGISAPATA